MKNQNSKNIMNGMFLMSTIVLAGSLFLQSCKKEESNPLNAPEQALQASDERIAGDYLSLARVGCDDGSCPVYSVTVTQSTDVDQKATVTYIGTMNVKTKGKVVWGVPIQEFNDMQDIFKQLGIYNMSAGYPHSPLVHSNTAISSLGKVKKVSDYIKGAPADLGTMQAKFETWLNIASLVSGSSDNGKAGDNIVLNRVGCQDGSCPAYNLSITQGQDNSTTATVLFEGLQNVKYIGMAPKFEISIDEFHGLQKAFKDSLFYDFKDEYVLSPYEESFTSINLGGNAKKVHDFMKETPSALLSLQQKTITVARAQDLIGQ